MTSTSDDTKVMGFAQKFKEVSLIAEDEARKEAMIGFFKELRSINSQTDFGMKVMKAISESAVQPNENAKKWSEAEIAFFAGGFRAAVKEGGENGAKQYIQDYVEATTLPVQAIMQAINAQAKSAGEEASNYKSFKELADARLLEIEKQKGAARKEFIKGYNNTKPPTEKDPNEGKWVRQLVHQEKTLQQTPTTPQ